MEGSQEFVPQAASDDVQEPTATDVDEAPGVEAVMGPRRRQHLVLVDAE
ncbi:MAG: hypothetical protein ACRDZP_04205 [Acidimicrobiales bacterium]